MEILEDGTQRIGDRPVRHQVVMANDEQQRRQGELSYGELVHFIPMGMHRYRLQEDERLVLVASNEAADRILDLPHAARIGQTIEHAFPGVVGTGLPDAIRDVARKGQGWQIEQFEYRDAELRGDFEIHAYPILPGEVVLLFNDVTEQTRDKAALERYRDLLEDLVGQLTREFQLAQEELVRNERLVTLGRLTASVAHELRNPLGVLQTAFFTLRDALNRGDDRRVDRTLAIAERTIERVDGIIAELLDFTRHRKLRKQPTDLDAWIGQILDAQPIRPGVILDRELRCGRRVDLDQEQILSAVTNLLRNALQALDESEGERRITVATRALDGWIEIRVLDTGPGIPEDVEDQVFEPLFSTKSFGVGLGLPIVRQVAEAHSGELRLYSVAGRGTTAVLRLPARPLMTSTEEADRFQHAEAPGGLPG